MLDECDRLFAAGFQSELRKIIENMNKTRQTLLFSATMTSSLREIENFAMKETLRFDLTITTKIPSTLRQEYLLMPFQVKEAYLGALLMKLLAKKVSSNEKDDIDDDNLLESFKNKRKTVKKVIKSSKKRNRRNNDFNDVNIDENDEKSDSLSFSIMIFVGTCKKCQELTEMLNELSIECVGLHSLISQDKRMMSLSMFKNQLCRILIATDVG